MENYYISNEPYTMQINNKKISISPVVDNNGVLSQEPIYDEKNNLIRYLSNFRYTENDNQTHQFKAFNILVDLDVDLYNSNSIYRNSIYTSLLSCDRIDKICNQYHRYAGGLLFNNKTNQYDKFVDPQILNSLDYKEKLEQQESSSFQKDRQDFLKRICPSNCHIKENHAEILTTETYREMYGIDDQQEL